jgi:PPP family 3-phenylpropionic acid transporter
MRLSSFYFIYFALLGTMIPYWGLYLQSLGFSAKEIGQLVSILMFTKVIAPNIWGWVGDRTQNHLKIVRLGAFLTWFYFWGVFFSSQFWWIASVMIAYSFFWNAILPQFEVITLGHLADETHRYSRVRLWGSIGFVFAVAGVGWLFDRISINHLPIILSMMMALIWASSLYVRQQHTVKHHEDNQNSFWKELIKPNIATFFGICFLMQLAHGIYYTFFSVYMQAIGYDHTIIGNLWALGVLAEVVVFLFMHKMIKKWGVRRILLASVLLASLRWALIAFFAKNLSILLMAQCLHAATFGSFHAVAIYWVHHTFKGKQEGQAQAFYSAISFGLGGALGALISGAMWERIGATGTFFFASMIALIAFLIAWKWIGRDQLKQDVEVLHG